MRQGQHGQKPVFRNHHMYGSGLLGIAQNIVVTQHHTFGPSCGTGSIDDGCQIVRIGL